MAINSRLYPGIPTTSPGVVLISGYVNIGSTGAVGTQVGKGFAVTRTGTGAYTIQITSSGAAASVPAVLYAVATLAYDNDTNYKVNVRTTPTTGALTVKTAAEAAPGTPADPPSGSKLQFFALVQNTADAR